MSEESAPKKARAEPAEPIAAVVDLAAFLADASSAEARAACAACAASLEATGIVLLRDARVADADQAAFLDMMEDYFAQPEPVKLADVRKEVFYQVGATPSNVEVPICKADDECVAAIAELPERDRPRPITGADPKWRFFWRIGERPAEGGFEDLNAKPVCPAHFPQWAETMDRWGGLMLAAVTTCAEMAAVGFGLPRDAISGLMHHGPHLLAPTGSDLGVGHANRAEGTVLAGYHNDVRKSARERKRARARAPALLLPRPCARPPLSRSLSHADPPKQLNLLTIHGKSRYPGLHVWTKDGTKMRVAIPPGCLLVQVRLSSRARAPERPNRPENTDSREK